MKILALLLLLVGLGSLANAQKGFVPVVPDQPVDFAQVNSSYAFVKGHWVDMDKRPQLTGPSVSEILCSRTKKTCTDLQANIIVMGNQFTLDGASDEYEVERWNTKEIVASFVGGLCRVRNVLKFDIVNKRIYYSRTLSEPVPRANLPESCTAEAVGMNLELKGDTMWWSRP